MTCFLSLLLAFNEPLNDFSIHIFSDQVFVARSLLCSALSTTSISNIEQTDHNDTTAEDDQNEPLSQSINDDLNESFNASRSSNTTTNNVIASTSDRNLFSLIAETITSPEEIAPITPKKPGRLLSFLSVDCDFVEMFQDEDTDKLFG